MKNTFRKSLSMILALMMIVAVMLSATACGGGGGNGDPDDKGSAGRSDFIDSLGGVSDTFKGAVSEESYESALEAAAAFVEEEVAGESEATVVNAVSKGEVSASSINIPDELTEGIVSVEEYEVEYSLSDGPALMSAGAGNSSKKITVYIIKYESEWKYFTPAPITGETISKSYYDSVFNAEKYKNCTYKSDMTMDMEMVAAAQGLTQTINMTMSMSQFVKYAEGKLYLEMTTSMTSNMPDMIGQGGNSTIKVYVEEVDGELTCYADIGDGEGWRETNLGTVGFGSLDDLTPFNDQYIDYSYFTKTDYGFKIADENAAKFIDELYSELLIMYDESFGIDMFAEYYVSDGVLSGMRMDMDMDINMSESGSTVTGGANIEVTTTCTDYGTTVVDKPVMN